MRNVLMALRLPRFLQFVILLATVALAAGWLWYFFPGGGTIRTDNTLEGLQVFATVPDFTLVERDTHRVTRADLLGTVWVANFIYTHCTDTCPLQSARMAALQREFAGERRLRFLSITVDPRRDTPAVLTQYAARYDADRKQWWFLTGDKRAIYALIQEGFHLSVEDPTDSAVPASVGGQRQGNLQGRPRTLRAQPTDVLRRILDSQLGPTVAFAHSDSDFLAPPFLHSSWFVLGDRQARIRGYYKTEEERSLKRLRRDIRVLLAER